MSEHLEEQALAFVMGELDESARVRALQHLNSCAACRAEVQRLQLATEAMTGLAAVPDLTDALTERIVAQTAWSGSPRRPMAPAWLRVAAMLLLVLAASVTGYQLGARSASRPALATAGDSLPRFLLLLEESSWPPNGPGMRPGYVEWAQTMRAAGRMVDAAKLTDEPGWRMLTDGSVQRPGQPDGPVNVSGWFLVRAQNYDSAFAWVRRGPHLRHGSVLVRQVE